VSSPIPVEPSAPPGIAAGAVPQEAPPPPVRFRSVLLAALIGAVILAGLWFIAWIWRGQPEQAAEWYDIARTVAFGFAALGVLPAGYIAYVRQRTHDWQLREDHREQEHREAVEKTRVDELAAKWKVNVVRLVIDAAWHVRHRNNGRGVARAGRGRRLRVVAWKDSECNHSRRVLHRTSASSTRTAVPFARVVANS